MQEHHGSVFVQMVVDKRGTRAYNESENVGNGGAFVNPNIKNFCVAPSVVRADRESELSISCFDGEMRFFDDITYEITCIPQEESDVSLDEEMSLLGYNKARRVQYVKPVNGVLKVRYYFAGEQEWRIHIATKEYGKHQNPLYEPYKDYWGWLINKPCEGIDLFVYSLQEDLYERRPLRGDLHVHTGVSDGKETVATVAACYRKAGRDFVAITDHNTFFSPAQAKETFGFMKNFTVLPGEEVHNGYVGYFHMVNIGGRYSVNRRYLEEKEAVKKEIEALSREIIVPNGVDACEYVARAWLYQEIKKSGGVAVFPHPFWKIGYNHVSTTMSKAIIQNGLCDAFEVLGGVSPRSNNLQVALYHDLRAEGCTIPAVGSTDSHTSREKAHTQCSTVVFAAKDGDILQAIAEGYSVPVESLPNENVRTYGNLRLSAYVHFLLENYFPLHEELCAISGVWMEEYVKGNAEAKELLEATEQKVTALKERFFRG